MATTTVYLMKLLIFLSSILIFYFMYGFYIAQTDLDIVPLQLKRENPVGYYDYKGVVNVHSNLSIGTSHMMSIINSARAVNLDFIMMTDLNVFQNPSDSFEGYHGNTLVFIGGKYSYLDSRLIYYSLKKDFIGDNLGEAQVKFSDFLTQNASSYQDRLLILAHPYKSGFSWSGEFPIGLDGLEIVNTKSLSNRAWEISKLSTIWSLVSYPFNPSLAFVRLFSEPSEELNLFDRMATERNIVGFAGSEASARAIPLANYLIKFPSYQRSFELFTNHILLKSELTGNAVSDKQKIFNALKNGQFYICFDMLGDPKGFMATVEDKNKIYMLGANVKFNKNLVLKVHLPLEPLDFFEVAIYKDGIRYETFNEVDVEMPIKEPGAYRIQVRVSPYLPLPDAKKWITWIYTNHFYVR